jgi:hypothetical protein
VKGSSKYTLATITVVKSFKVQFPCLTKWSIAPENVLEGFVELKSLERKSKVKKYKNDLKNFKIKR